MVDEGFYMTTHPSMIYVEQYLLHGLLEALCKIKFISHRIVKDGKRYIVFTKKLNNETETNKLGIENEELENMIDQIVDHIILNKPSGRVKLNDVVDLSGEQIFTYFMQKTDEEHKIIEKYAGIRAGKKLAEKARIFNEKEALGFIKKIFEQEKIGQIIEPIEENDEIRIIMNESAYSSGVKNIHLMLDLFPAGMMEGIISQATKQKWTVEETKCLANGDNHCEFILKKNFGD